MFNTKLNELRNDGVSPVIGVILMVAITVILAAVIGTFVLGLADDLDQDAQAAVTFDDDGSQVVVQVNSVQSADSLSVESSADDSSQSLTASAGSSVTISGSAYADGETLTVVGTLDGSDNVIQTYEM